MRSLLLPWAVLSAAVALFACVALPTVASAEECSSCKPWWHLDSGSRPTDLRLGSEGEVVVTAENVGDASAASGVRVVDTLPAGLEVVSAGVGVAGTQPMPGGTVTETLALSCSRESASRVSCESTAALVPYDQLEVRIEVKAPPPRDYPETKSSTHPGAKTLAANATTSEGNEVSVTGGGAPPASISRPLILSEEATLFGVEDYELSVEGEGGVPVTQAGSHPYQVTGTIMLDQGPDAASLASAPQAAPAVLAKDVVARLPVGLIADPTVVPRCLPWQFIAKVTNGREGVSTGVENECPALSAVGVASVTADEPGGGGTFTFAAPVFNVEPEAGEPARFGFLVPFVDVPVLLNTAVRSGPGEDWGVNLYTSDIPQNVGLVSVRVTFWGVPDRSSHQDARGWGCLALARGSDSSSYEPCVSYVEERHPPAFVTLPTSCTGALQSSVQADSWEEPGQFQSFPASEQLQAMTGCEQLAFSPEISTEPTTHSASSPSGLSFDLDFDTEGLTSAAGVAQSDLQKTVVTLPEGMTIDPSAGVGLGACTSAQYAQATLDSAPGAGCPEDSKLGTVEIETPLLFTTVYGSLYIAQPYENPFSEPGHPGGSLIAIYVIARSRAERGILVKLTGQVIPNPVTGQLTIVFAEDPQLPFDHFKFHFREGQQAPLISPATCGTFTTQALLSPFSEPSSVLTDTSSFQVTSGSEGSACPGALPPFEPAISSETLDSRAGVFSPFAIDLTRTDAMAQIASYSASLPVGLTADLSGVPFCPQTSIEQARRKTGMEEEMDPSCPAASVIGHSLVGTGVGSVLDYVPGVLYFAGPFHGDPYSVVSVTSAVIGPFDLGTVVIRFGLRIDPYTAQVSIDPTGSEPIPTIIDGIVTHVRDIRVSIDRPGFTLNPTNCAALPVSSTMTSNLGQDTTVSTPFQATGCEHLAFKPHFSAWTKGKASRADGASLSVKLTMPDTLGSQLGSEANIKQVKVDLPKQLPSRLTTLQQACTEQQFNSNPAGCPKASMIGYAKAITPILPVPLTGPAIFVSHGDEQFPSLILVLQGYGVTIDLVGATFINKAGITSTTFKTVPDEPVGSFELTLPQGKYSALAANTNLCTLTKTIILKKKTTIKHDGHNKTITRKTRKTIPATTLQMPTIFTAQNNMKIHQNTPIKITGCTKPKTHQTTRKKHRTSASRRTAIPPLARGSSRAPPAP